MIMEGIDDHGGVRTVIFGGETTGTQEPVWIRCLGLDPGPIEELVSVLPAFMFSPHVVRVKWTFGGTIRSAD